MATNSNSAEERSRPAVGALRHRVFGGLLWTLSGTGFHGAAQFITVVVISRLLTPAEVGVASAVTIIVWFAQTFSQLGVGPGIVQRPILTDRYIATGLSLALLFGIGTGAVIFLGAGPFATVLKLPASADLIRIIALVFPIVALSTVSESLLQRNMRFKALMFIDAIGYGLGYGVTAVLLAAAGAGPWYIVGAQLAQAVLRTVLLAFAARHRWSFAFHRTEARRLLSYGTAISLGKIGHFMGTQGDNMIVARFLGAADLGFYGRAFQFVTLPANLLGGALDRVLFPAIGSIQDNPVRMARAYMRSVAVAAMVMLPMSSVLGVAAPEIIVLTLGPRWEPVIVPFQILVCSLVFRTSARLSDSLARATGVVYQRAWRQWIYAAAVVAGAYVGRSEGLWGVSAGVVLAAILNFSMMLKLSVRSLELSWTTVSQVYLRHFAIAAGMTTAALVAADLARQSGLPDVLTIVAITIAAGFAWVVLLKLFPRLFGDDLSWAIDLVRQRRSSRSRSDR